jgi:hypothetical protein
MVISDTSVYELVKQYLQIHPVYVSSSSYDLILQMFFWNVLCQILTHLAIYTELVAGLNVLAEHINSLL